MKIKQMCMALLFWLGLISGAQAQTYENLWKEVKNMEQKSLPKSAMKLTEDIFKKAEKERNSPQMQKAYMWRMRYKESLSPDSFYVSLKELEEWAQRTDKLMDRAILHSLMAGIYAEYASENRWQLSQRAEVGPDVLPEDIREWTGNMFVDKVRKHAREAVKDSVELLQTSSDNYRPFVIQKETSAYFHHDMYHLLASRSIASLEQIEELDHTGAVKREINAMYRSMIDTYGKQGDKEAVILVSIDLLKWQHRSTDNFSFFRMDKTTPGTMKESYLKALDDLAITYSSADVCAEIYLAKAEYAMQKEQPANALHFCDEGIRLYPKYHRINTLKNLRSETLAPYLSVNTVQTVYPGGEMQIKAEHNNLDGFTLRLSRAQKTVMEQHYALLRPKDYRRQDTVFTFKAPEIGEYEITFIPDIRSKDLEKSSLYVTRFKVLTGSLSDNQYEVITLDAQTGHPISNAKVAFYGNGEELLQEVITGADGKTSLPGNKKYHYLKATKGTDTAMPKQYIYHSGYSRYDDGERASEKLTLLTDRSLYRPGQTIYIKGIAYMQRTDAAEVLQNKKYTMTLLDANDQEVGKETVVTNEFGSFAVNFALPSVALNGIYAITAGESRTNIRVEEYKRPTFDISLEKLTDSYRLGDEVHVKGKVQSFSGAVMPHALVKYTVKRSTFIFWRSIATDQIAVGEVTSDADGTFSFPVRLEEKEANENDSEGTEKGIGQPYYHYIVETTVTSMSGETQSSTQVIVAGKQSLIVQSVLPERISKDVPLNFTCRVENLNGESVAVEGTYRLFRAKDKDMKQLEEKPVAFGAFTSNKEIPFDWKGLPSGAYVLKVFVKDGEGKEVIAEAKTVLFSEADKRPPVETTVWFYESNTKMDTAHPAVFYFGTSEKDAYILMNVFCRKKRLESKVLRLSDEIVRFEYPYRAEYGDGLAVNFCMVRGGELYQHEVQLEKRLPETKLTMKWDVFRDKLRPGQQEEWRLTILNPQGKPADAEMLATMYDASLDKIWNTKQGFNLFYRRVIPSFNWTTGHSGTNSFSYQWEQNLLKVKELEYDYMDTYIASNISSALSSRSYGMQTKSAILRGGSDIVELEYISPKLKTLSEPSANDAQLAGIQHDLPEPSVDLRTNLAETAFFYPQLRTNEKGEVLVSFTMPESLTRWNFRGYAHTKDMLTGTLEGESTTSKEFMLTPNLPRFVRVGDETSLAASIANLTTVAQAGTVTLILFDPATEKVIRTDKQKFTVEAGQTIGVDFRFTATDEHPVLGCRLMAESDAFSDGEQQLLPVLSDKEHLTETLAMPIRGEETRTLSLDKLFNGQSRTAVNRQLTIEFTGNPAWYAVQALPSLGTPASDNAISWATAFYANSLASYIMNSQPRVKDVFESWKLQGGRTKEAFLSNLQKNQEVKNLLLSESPWVLQAQTEQQQKERIATLFDLNNIRNGNLSTLTKLRELQNPDGSWTWYRGMNGSRYITAYIAELNARLALLTCKKPEGLLLEMQQKTMSYLHREALKEYNDVLKLQKKGNKWNGISATALQYLYLVAISGEEVPAVNKKAHAYFLSRVGGLLSSRDMDTKAAAAIVLEQAGRKKEAQSFIASLKEHLTKTDEQGMFFDFNENPYSWGGLKLQAHVDVMEAFMLTGGNTDIVEEMKLWLLKQKQTQQWNSPIATADAVYALLMKGTNLLENLGDVRVLIGNEVIETYTPTKSTVPLLGYVKRLFTQPEVLDTRIITVEKRNSGIAWGAVYAGYDSPIGDVKQQGSELNVEKKLYVERTVDNKPQLQLITGKTMLHVGDKVTSRVTIRLDRTMDFIQLKDQRAACFEPIGNLSGYLWGNGFGYYVDVKDASTNFFFDHLGKGVYVLEYSYRINRSGTYETGLAMMQCAYAPEYASHSGSTKINVR